MVCCAYLLIFSTILSAFHTGNGKQNSYTFVPEFSKVSFVDPEYAEVLNWSFKKFNKTTGGFNLDFIFKKDMPRFLNHIVGYVFKSNEFKRTAFDFVLDLCSVFDLPEQFDIGHILEDGNLTLKCPIPKGSYYIHNMIANPSNYPPLMPAGRWLFKQELKANDAHFATLDLIYKIQYL